MIQKIIKNIYLKNHIPKKFNNHHQNDILNQLTKNRIFKL